MAKQVLRSLYSSASRYSNCAGDPDCHCGCSDKKSNFLGWDTTLVNERGQAILFPNVSNADGQFGINKQILLIANTIVEYPKEVAVLLQSYGYDVNENSPVDVLAHNLAQALGTEDMNFKRVFAQIYLKANQQKQ